MRAFQELVDEAAAADVSGWSFDWLNGRATEQRPPWRYSRLLAFELIEYFRGPLPHERFARDPHREVAAARRSGLEIVELRTTRCRMEFFEIGAVVYTLRKCAWWVLNFAVERHRARLERLDAHIRTHGTFVAHSTRTLIEVSRVPRRKAQQ
ncbi:hypothetical protein [Salinispora fenicalii]|uniref:hypothetical protein n=1 Tax=Salinispora fenicalii TaxID=1137263 RepID=UPI000484F9DD|nr:hypothetical protein [Salinispora fenicalii]